MSEKTINIEIRPGCHKALWSALDLFGNPRVHQSYLGAPVRIHDLSTEEADFAKEFFASDGLTVTEV